MNIIHYNLGLPPFRSGGLTKYSVDLMQIQSTSGENVFLLYPGRYTFWKSTALRIIKNNQFNTIIVYEIENPVCVPLRYGVGQPSVIFNQKEKIPENTMLKFYEIVKPDILHIHTLMGLPIELLLFLKNKGVKILFTSHDYYGLCLKVNFINQNSKCCNNPNGLNCAICNSNTPGLPFLRLRNSNYLLKYKSYFSLPLMNSGKIETYKLKLNKQSLKRQNEYSEILEYYLNIFNHFDCFHFNSTIAKEIYEKYLTPKLSMILPVSNAEITDNRTRRKLNSRTIRIGFIGSLDTYKGFSMLKNALLHLLNLKKENWILQVWGNNHREEDLCSRIIYNGNYSTENLNKVFNSIDLLIVPSIWKETFSLVALEALSFGVPVLVSCNVGAKDIINEYNADFIFEPSVNELISKLQIILDNPELIDDFADKICLNKFNHTLSDHSKEIKHLYNTLLGT